MKKTNCFSYALAMLMLGACSNEDVVVNEDGQGAVAPGEKGFVSLSINLPTKPSTRANDQFNDGEAYEYDVNDATLLIFTGLTEREAAFSGAYNLKGVFSDTDGDQITTSTKIIQQIERPDNNTIVYALVVLNKNGFLSNDGSNWYYGSDGEEKTELTGVTTFADLAYTAKTLNMEDIAKTDDGGNFLMLNAPLYDKPGSSLDPSGGKVTTLAVLDPNKIYPTEVQAQNNPAASIYVERAVAKVTVKENENFSSNSKAELHPELKGWILDVTNKKTFPVRNMGDDPNWWGYNNANAMEDLYRFVGGSSVESGSVTSLHYRTYFGIDPNYDGFDNSVSYVDESNNVLDSYNGFNVNYGKTPIVDLISMGANSYCLENTFNVENMRKDQTTRVIVAAKLDVDGAEDSGNFYVLNGDKTTLFKQDDVIKKIKDAYIKHRIVQDALNDPVTGLKGDPGVVFDGNDIDVKFKKVNSEAVENIGDLPGGTVIVAEVYTKAAAESDFKGESVPDVLASNNTTVTADINDTYDISFYKEGVAYYPVQIKHFGDSQTPWDGVNQGYAESYPNPGREENWLGRYGVLRNNWYEIVVNSVKNIGSAEIEPEIGNDDPVDAWISVEINILSWAKRSQNVDL